MMATPPAHWWPATTQWSWQNLIMTGSRWRPSLWTRAKRAGSCTTWKLISCLFCTGMDFSSESRSCTDQNFLITSLIFIFFSSYFVFLLQIKGILGRPRTIPDHHAFGNEVEQSFIWEQSKNVFFLIINKCLLDGAWYTQVKIQRCLLLNIVC